MFHVNGQDDIDGFYYWVSNVYEDDLKAINMSIDSLILSKITHLILISMFQSYASVETKYIAPKSKSIQGIKSYKNGTNIGITYLTSKWFTNLVRSEGFSVRGHFRLQPKKVNGEWSKELIWIDTFEKQGYTSSAQILKHDKSSKQSI